MTRILGEWAEPCHGCGALDGCCSTSKMRLDVASDLEKLVRRQSAKITELDRAVGEKQAVIDDLRRKYEGAKA